VVSDAPSSTAHTFADSLDDVVFVPFEGSGHYLHREAPEAFVETLRELLERPSFRPERLRANVADR
jgi:pimeloyl-ACP methyl ester carboxylesterase